MRSSSMQTWLGSCEARRAPAAPPSPPHTHRRSGWGLGSRIAENPRALPPVNNIGQRRTSESCSSGGIGPGPEAPGVRDDLFQGERVPELLCISGGGGCRKSAEGVTQFMKGAGGAIKAE